ncbi:hypothetical protein ABL78_4658 [Leptomonas seymouri]|uniref:Uncharacterized protein n=1 Tax=Leptomonas seymouri TaxID=5684 RepID=A0A0N1PBV2_LEPSE|nr:hypothetical protein ABL78_4658 [Leptomonas seymouri]|eukprot:KPI86275.1 hypothetical protein ABL78_4658 [Leptomonas seymouri]
MRACCASRLSATRLQFAWGRRHASLPACASAVGAEDKSAGVAAAPCPAKPLFTSPQDVAPCSSSFKILEKAHHCSDLAAPVKHRKVQINAATLQQLPHAKRVHLAQLESLLRRRAPHIRRLSSYTHRAAAGGSSMQSCTAYSFQKTSTTSRLTGFAPPGKSPSDEDQQCNVSTSSPQGGLLVMCRVVARPFDSTQLSDSGATRTLDDFSDEHTCACMGGENAEEVFTGVNHAFHKHVNPRGATLRGILKGCAEQNALGAAAASGCAYMDITDVFVFAACMGVDELEDGQAGYNDAAAQPMRSSTSNFGGTHATAIFPCPECWCHLCHVARARHQHALPRLRLFVCASSPSATAHLLSQARQRMEEREEPMEVCIVTRHYQRQGERGGGKDLRARRQPISASLF